MITPTPMTDLVPIHLASKGMLITQFDLEAIEKLGLVKIDLLGTRGLSVLGEVSQRVYGWQKRDYANASAVLRSTTSVASSSAAIARSCRASLSRKKKMPAPIAAMAATKRATTKNRLRCCNL